MRKIEIPSKREIKNWIKEEVDKKTFKQDRIINMLWRRVLKSEEEIKVR